MLYAMSGENGMRWVTIGEREESPPYTKMWGKNGTVI